MNGTHGGIIEITPTFFDAKRSVIAVVELGIRTKTSSKSCALQCLIDRHGIHNSQSFATDFKGRETFQSYNAFGILFPLISLSVSKLRIACSLFYRVSKIKICKMKGLYLGNKAFQTPHW